MKMGKFFYLGVGLCLAGIVLMSLPVKPCVDCFDNELIPYLAEDGETILHREPDDSEVAGD